MGHRLPRHTAATLLLVHRAQPLVVSEMLVYASVAFTLTRYGHVLADMRRPARNTIERLFGGAGAKLGAEWRGEKAAVRRCWSRHECRIIHRRPRWESNPDARFRSPRTRASRSVVTMQMAHSSPMQA